MGGTTIMSHYKLQTCAIKADFNTATQTETAVRALWRSASRFCQYSIKIMMRGSQRWAVVIALKVLHLHQTDNMLNAAQVHVKQLWEFKQLSHKNIQTSATSVLQALCV